MSDVPRPEDTMKLTELTYAAARIQRVLDDAAAGDRGGQYWDDRAADMRAITAALSTPPASQAWREVADAHPAPHARYEVVRDGVLFTATPCYGLHAPWWVVKTMTGEADPVPFAADDRWRPAPPRPSETPGEDGTT